MVDAGIIMTENIARHISATPQKKKPVLVLRAAHEVGGGIFFSMLIIITAFVTIIFSS